MERQVGAKTGMNGNPHPMHRPLTVLQILPSLESGGVERGTVEMNAALTARGHRSIVVSAGGRLMEKIIADGGEHISLDIGKKSPLTLFKAGQLRKIITDCRANLVNVRSRMPAWVTLIACKRMPPAHRPRLVTTVHGLNGVSWYSKVMTYGEKVIAVSDCCREYVLTNYPDTDPAKVVTIHRGVSSQEFPFQYVPQAQWITTWRKEYPQLVGRFVATLPGRLTRLKGHFEFLQAIHIAKAAGVPIHGLIVGGVDPRRQAYAESIHTEVARLGLTQDITFTGQRSDLREIMCLSDVVVSTTLEPPESFGRTVLESIKLGRPTLGYDHGGVGEILRAIYPQGCVPLRDRDAMAAKLLSVHREELSLPEPTDAFDLPTLLGKEIALYEELCETADR